MFNKTTSFFLISFISFTSCLAQQDKPNKQPSHVSNLFNEIVLADSLLFNAFNNCDSLAYKQYFTDDLEFYHDRGGLTVSLKSELQSFKENCATDLHLRRELVKSSLKVYPIKNYGAIEIGTHRFYHTKTGETEKLNGSYEFIHIWRLDTKGKWKLSRIISYGH